MDGVVLEEVSGIVKTEEGVVDGDDSGVIVKNSGTADEASDAAESVDSELNWHGASKWWYVLRVGLSL